MSNWHAREISDLVLESGTDICNGRSVHGSERKRKKNNKIFLLPASDTLSIVKKMASDASLILLSVTFIIAALVSQPIDSCIGIAFIILAFAVGVYILHRSSMRITNSYRMLLPDAKIVENGSASRLSVFDVEVNDLITFTQGDIIAADARLVDSSALIVAERVFNEATGRYEYNKFPKDHLHIAEEDQIAHSPNMVYAGSMVISGKGSAIVTAIGDETLICKNHSPISIVSENDRPEYLRAFEKKARRFSLIVLSSVIPLSLIGICLNSMIEKNNADFLSSFALSLALAATTMSELTVSSAEAIITKELLPSSVISKIEKKPVSKITKLSAAEELALTDTVLIMTPDVLIDQRQLVRRIYFSGNQYRYDAIYSNDIKDFANQIISYFSLMPRSAVHNDDRIIGDFLARFSGLDTDKCNNAKFLRNFPVKGSRSCVFESDDAGKPVSYIAATNDFSLILNCVSFRTEGGGLWKLSRKDMEEAKGFFDSCYSSEFLRPLAFFSRTRDEDKLVFEGIVCTGEEFPYSDGEVLDNLLEAGIHPILVLESENNRNIEIAKECGFLRSHNDIAIHSDYLKAGLGVSDAHVSTKIYVGFGRKGTQIITKRLADNSRKVLPIIKDSANRYDVSPFNAYATSAQHSLDSVKISSSLSIAPNISEKRAGGLSDALKAVLASSMAFLKLGIYKNYLVFAAFLRIFTVALPFAFGYSYSIISPNSLLLCGFFCDFSALLAIAYYKGIPVKAQNALAETKKMFSLSASLVSCFISLIVSSSICSTIGYLVKTGALGAADAHLVISGSLVATTISAIGGFLLLLRGRTREHKFSISYWFIVLLVLLFVIAEIFFPTVIAGIGLISFKTQIIPHITAVSVLSFLSVVILGNLSSFSSSRRD